MTSILEFSNISRAYTRGVPVLDGVSFSVAPGEVVGLLGRNGSGKTTLIRIAKGMLYPHGGSVRVFGLSPTENPVAVKKRIGYVAEDQILPLRMTIAELVDFHRYLFPHWNDALQKQLMDRFGLHMNSKIKRLSKGEARQVALLCAVCHRPELLILDEPAGGLDPAARRGPAPRGNLHGDIPARIGSRRSGYRKDARLSGSPYGARRMARDIRGHGGIRTPRIAKRTGDS